MNLDIALELEHDVIRLLRQGGDAETELGTLRLDDPNFDKRLAALRNGVCGDKTDVRILLPRSLVLFLEVGNVGESELKTRVQNETPCPIDELIIARDGPHAAAVERATLEEAQEFAEAHGFRPAAFAAHPGKGNGGAITFRFDPPPLTFRSNRTAPEPGEAAPEGPPEERDVPAQTSSPASADNSTAANAVPPEGDSPAAQADAQQGETLAAGASHEPPVEPSMERAPAFAAHEVEAPAHQTAPDTRGSRPLPHVSLSEALAATAEPEHAPESETPDSPRGDGHLLATAVDWNSPAVAVKPRSRAIPDVAGPGLASPHLPRNDAPVRGPAAPRVARVAPALTPRRVEPAESEADALTVFGARGEPDPERRGFTLLHAAAAVLMAGVVFAAYELIQGDGTTRDILNLDEIATGTIDPLTEARDEEAAADAEPEVAALDPSVSVAPRPRPPSPPPQEEAAAVPGAAPQSELATPVALPAPVQLDTPEPPVAPPMPGQPEPESLAGFTPPPPPGTVFDMDERGLVRPTEDGALTPNGVLVHSGQPDLLPPPAALEPAEGAPPPAEELADTQDDAALAPSDGTPVATAPDLPSSRPEFRPDAAPTFEVAVLEAGEDTPRPAARPGARANAAVEVAVAAAVASPDFDDLAEQARTQTAAAGTGIAATAPRATEPPPPEPEGRHNVAVQPSLPTRTSVAQQATVQNALSLNRVNLIGVYGSASDRRALIRLPTGRYIKVKVGDRVDGGQVASIQNSSVEYVKGGQRYALTLPSG